tara:strand:+ start:1642 stop:2259 length:618 start_codon:yes stop_codon:yes gene_type:complete
MKLAMRVKVCGLNNKSDLLTMSKLKVDFFGFIFYKKSPRYFFDYPLDIDKDLNSVGVFVNESLKKISEIVETLSLNYVQLHGNEDVKYCKQIQKKCKVIKVFRVEKEINIDLIKKFYDCCDIILFDTFTKKYGGSGKKFDWDILIKNEIKKNFILSGGIDFDDIEKIKYLKEKNSFFYGIDLNSRFEIEPGKKNNNKIEKFLKNF